MQASPAPLTSSVHARPSSPAAHAAANTTESTPAPHPLGLLGRLPEELLVDVILPQAIGRGFLPGLQNACHSAAQLCLQLALRIKRSSAAREEALALRAPYLGVQKHAVPLPPLLFDARQSFEAGRHVARLSRHDPHVRWEALVPPNAEAEYNPRAIRGRHRAMVEAVAAQPHDNLAHERLGSVTLMRSGHERGEEHLLHAVELGARRASTYALLGIARSGQRDYAGAEFWVRRALALDGGSAPTHALLATFLQGQGRHEEADEARAVAQRLDPKFLDTGIASTQYFDL